jgi:hypothetical protein
MTPEQVLHALRHFAQINDDYPITDPEMGQIATEMKLANFDEIRDSGGDLGRGLNYFFGCAITDAEWREVLNSPKKRTVGELCDFLSKHVTFTPVELFKVLDRVCRPAAIFLTLKTQLARHGVDVSKLSPSTPIRLYSWDYAAYCYLIREAVLIAPERLPLSEPGTALTFMGCGQLLGCGLLLLLVASAVSMPWLLGGFAVYAIALVVALGLAGFQGWNHIRVS